MMNRYNFKLKYIIVKKFVFLENVKYNKIIQKNRKNFNVAMKIFIKCKKENNN